MGPSSKFLGDKYHKKLPSISCWDYQWRKLISIMTSGCSNCPRLKVMTSHLPERFIPSTMHWTKRLHLVPYEAILYCWHSILCKLSIGIDPKFSEQIRRESIRQKLYSGHWGFTCWFSHWICLLSLWRWHHWKKATISSSLFSLQMRSGMVNSYGSDCIFICYGALFIGGNLAMDVTLFLEFSTS